MRSAIEKEINQKVISYFTKLPSKKFLCTLCNKNFSGGISNEKDHLLAKHKDIAESIGLKGKEKPTASSQDTDAENSVCIQLTKKVKLEIDINAFIRNHIKLILLHNHALSSIEDIMNMPHNAKICEEFMITINRRTFTQFIINASQQIYKLIGEETKDKYPSIGFDSASKHGRSVFSVHIRYVQNDQIKERTLGLITQYGRQFGNILASQIIELFAKIEKPIDDIYACCSDGGANMMKTQELIISAQSELEIYSVFFENEEEVNINEFICEDDSIESTATEDIEEESEINWNNILNIENGIGTLCSKGHCGAHMCQLGARDVTKDFDSILQKIRAFVKEPKKIVYLEVFKELKKLSLDIGPRWDSTFLMIEKFETQKVAFSQIRSEKLKLTRETWNFISEYYEAFLPVHLAMKDFQQVQYTSSDFLLRWMRMQMQIERIQPGSYRLSTKLAAAMKERSRKFFLSEAFCAALVLDPRFTWNSGSEIFNDEVRDKGISNILKVNSKIHSNVNTLNTEEPLTASSDSQINSQLDDEDYNLEEFLGGGSRIEYRQNEFDIKQQIMKFIYSEPRVRPSENFKILNFWHN